MPVMVVWTRRDGVRLRESAETEDVSMHGALLRLEARLAPGTPLNLSRPDTLLKAPGHVVRTIIRLTPAVLHCVAIELSVPAGEFWEEKVS